MARVMVEPNVDRGTMEAYGKVLLSRQILTKDRLMNQYKITPVDM